MRNLAAGGGSLLGKTNHDEFAMGSSNENSGYGLRATRPDAAVGRRVTVSEKHDAA